MLEELINKIERIAKALEKIAGEKELNNIENKVSANITGQEVVTAINQPVAAQPVIQPQPQVIAAVPLSTEVKQYSQEEIARAMGRAIDMGRMAEIQYILSLFKVQALTDLPENQYGDLVIKLKEIGVEV